METLWKHLFIVKLTMTSAAKDCLPAKVQNRFMINMESTGGSHRQITLKYVSFHVYLRLLINLIRSQQGPKQEL